MTLVCCPFDRRAMSTFRHLIALTAPLFLLIAIGYALARFGRWPSAASDGLSRFVFGVAIPAFLFRLMSSFSQMPEVDAMLLVAYFGGCLIVYALGRLVAKSAFAMDGATQSVFALGGIFANTVLLGLPLAKATLGDAALPAMSLVIVFNSLILWTLCTVSVEWARQGAVSVVGLARLLKHVVRNPIVASILLGLAFGFSGLDLPAVVDKTITLLADAALPLALVALGMGLAEYGIREGRRESFTITALKLVAHPLAVFALGWALRLPPIDLQAVVVLAALPVGANVYLMARQFDVAHAPVASSLVLSTVLAALSVPVVLALLGVAAG